MNPSGSTLLQGLKPPRWLAYAILCLVLFGVWAVIYNALSVSALQAQALSTVGQIPVMFLLACRGPVRPRGRQWRVAAIALAAGLMGGLGNMALYQALRVGEATAAVVPLANLYPLLTTILAVWFFRERLRLVQVLGIGAALVAILLFSGIHGGVPAVAWPFYALWPIVIWGVGALLQKIASVGLPDGMAAFWFLFSCLPLTGVLLFVDPVRVAVSPAEWLRLFALGACYAFACFAQMVAYASGGKTSVVTTLSGLYALVAIPLAWLFFHQPVSPQMMVAIVISVAAATAMSYEKPAAAAPPADTRTIHPEKPADRLGI